MQKRLIIGRNSKVVQSLILNPDVFDLISHKDAPHTDFALYEKVFLFSFPKNEHEIENYDNIVQLIDPNKLIFISTIAISALNKRPQWNFYPRYKKLYEDKIKSRGGSILRIGIFDLDTLKKLFGPIPVTTENIISEAMSFNYLPGSIHHAYKIQNIKTHIFIKLFSQMLHQLTHVLPSARIFQIPIQAFAKIIGLKYYGYTADALHYYADTIQIGYGALGSAYHRHYKFFNDARIIVSDEADYVLDGQGFVNTIVGKHRYGLGRKWHGVSLLHTNTMGHFLKKVPLFVSRPRRNLPFTERGSVVEIEHTDRLFWNIAVLSKKGGLSEYYANKLVLAAGPTENIRLLGHFFSTETTASDHETANLGDCSLRDTIAAGLIQSKLGIFLRPAASVALSTRAGVKFVVECRPQVPSRALKGVNPDHFYQSTSAGIFYRLLIGLSFLRLNEAVFNKLGWSFSTPRTMLFVQCVAKDAISFGSTGDSTFYEVARRRRLSSSDWDDICQAVDQMLPSFSRRNRITSFDALHIMGGAQLLANDCLRALVASKSLTIVGSPTHNQLDVRHHTTSFLEEIKRKAPLLIYCPEADPLLSPHFEISNAILLYRNRDNDRVVTNLPDLLKYISIYHNVMFQKTKPENFFIMSLLKVMRKNIIYYVHEPLSIKNRLRKGVPLFKALAVSFTHRLETFLSDLLLTGNSSNTAYCGRMLNYAPLIFPPIEMRLGWSGRSNKILYFGRLDEEKFYSEFLSFEFPKRVVATANLNVKFNNQKIKKYTINEKNKFFQLSKFVWAVQRNNFSQSGVVVDALRAGCVLLIKKNDPISKKIHPSAYISLNLPLKENEILEKIYRHITKYPDGPENVKNFSRIAGYDAYCSYWENLIG